jgi:hypothetical protein
MPPDTGKPADPDLTAELDAAEDIVMGGTRADIPPARVEIVSGEGIHVRRNPDGSAEIATAVLGGPTIALAAFEWRALCEVIRRLDRGEEVPP